jgi:hypothetical protein
MGHLWQPERGYVFIGQDEDLRGFGYGLFQFIVHFYTHFSSYRHGRQESAISCAERKSTPLLGD